MVLPGAFLASRMVLRDAVGVYPDPVGTPRSLLPGLDDFPDRTVALLPARSDLVGGMLFFPTEVPPAPLLFNLKLSTSVVGSFSLTLPFHPCMFRGSGVLSVGILSPRQPSIPRYLCAASTCGQAISTAPVGEEGGCPAAT